MQCLTLPSKLTRIEQGGWRKSYGGYLSVALDYKNALTIQKAVL